MRRVSFKRLSIRNFLSVGDIPVIIDFQDGIKLITGRNLDKPDAKNGAGKCLDPLTNIDMCIENKMVQEKFEKYLKNVEDFPRPIDK